MNISVRSCCLSVYPIPKGLSFIIAVTMKSCLAVNQKSTTVWSVHLSSVEAHKRC